MTQLQRDKTFEPSGVNGKLKIVLHDVSGTLIRALGTIERRGYDYRDCLLYTSPSPRDATLSRMPSSA